MSVRPKPDLMLRLLRSVAAASQSRFLHASPAAMDFIIGTQLRQGSFIRFNGALCEVVSVQHVTAAQRSGYIQAEIRDIQKGNKISQRFRSGEQVEQIELGKAEEFQVLYTDSDKAFLMHSETFEQTEMAKEVVGGPFPLLQEGMKLQVRSFEGAPVSVKVQRFAEFEVKSRAPGDSVIVGNGVSVRVPGYVSIGDKIKIDVDEIRFMERTQKVA